MKLLFLTPQLSNYGGIERTITDKANYFVEMGHQVSIVTYEQLDRPYAYSLSTKVHHTDLANSFNLLYRYPLFKRIFKYWKMIRSFKEGFKKIVVDFCPDVIVITAPDTEHYLRSVLSVSKGIKIVIESHSTFDHHFDVNGLWCRFSYFFQRPKEIYRKVDLVIALTNADAQCWRNFNIRNIEVVPNPVSFYCENVEDNNDITGQIIAVGRLHHGKRFDRLILAFSLIAKKHPTWNLAIYGKGEEKEKLNGLISQLNLSNQIRISYVTKDIMSEYMKSAFFVCSSDYEGFSLVLVEAMACGIPCVSTACPNGPLEIIEDGVNGLLSKMDSSDLASKMDWMITHEKERRKMGQNAHRFAARYKKEIVMKKWEDAYLSVTL